jgi:CRISPR/Cas system CSM-associated protein Csm3 (group 7 of RAMP superfamily)
MNRNEHSRLFLARVVLEAVTPLSLTTGTPDHVFDTALARDANGLPAIPGSSLAGVLRHLWWDEHGEDSMAALFGYQKRSEGQPSRLQLSWGHLLDSRGRAAEGLLLGEAGRKRLQDPLYAAALAQAEEPVFRNRVRITHRGAAADEARLDRAVLPAGNRFALELRLWARPGEGEEEWNRLLGLLAHPGFRLGGATRAGLGRMKACSVHQRFFDLEKADDAGAFCQLARSLDSTDGLQPHQPEAAASGWLEGTLELEARGLWRIGQGDTPLAGGHARPADLLPVVEERILWENGRGRRGPVFALMPGSSLKGALAHRMAFHLRRLSGQWAADDNRDERLEALESLLGVVKEESGGGSAGLLFVDDASLPTDEVKIARLMHNAIDRFTGGVRDRVLYEEESLFGGTVRVNLALHRVRLGDDQTLVRKALAAAIGDLAEGRLGLGSRSTTGNGFFEGRLTGELNDWLKQVQQENAA